MRKTSSYGLVLYDPEDKMIITADKDSLNHTMELIDEALGKKTTLTDVAKYIEENKDTLKGEDGYSPTIEVSKKDKVTTITITDINGIKTAIINDGEDGNGAIDEDTDSLLGQTPYITTKNISKLKLVADGKCTYTIKSDTIADLTTVLVNSLTKATFTKQDDYYELANAGGTTDFYQSYMDITFSDLVIGNTYTFIRDSSGLTFDANQTVAQTYGHYIIYDSNDTTLFNGEKQLETQKAVYTFEAPTSSIRVRLFPSNKYYYNNGSSVGRFRNICLNEGEVIKYTTVVNLSGSFTDKAILSDIPSGITVNTTPSCDVYEVDDGSENAVAKSRHAGKICVCFGDSITGNMLPPGDYCSTIANETGMTVYNCGFGGCRMGYHPDPAYNAFSMYSLSNSVASGDWTLQDTHVNGVSVHIHADVQLGNLKAINWKDVDFVTIAYGTNDIASDMSLDNKENAKDITTILGALRYSIEKILTAYPHIKILILTPIYRYWNKENTDSDSKSFAGGTFVDLIDGILKVAEEYKIPAVDMYRTLGFNSITRSYYFPANDGTHPNNEGLQLMGGKIAGRLLAEY